MKTFNRSNIFKNKICIPVARLLTPIESRSFYKLVWVLSHYCFSFGFFFWDIRICHSIGQSQEFKNARIISWGGSKNTNPSAPIYEKPYKKKEKRSRSYIRRLVLRFLNLLPRHSSELRLWRRSLLENFNFFQIRPTNLSWQATLAGTACDMRVIRYSNDKFQIVWWKKKLEAFVLQWKKN